MDEILGEELITNAEAKFILKKRSKDIQLGYEQKNALDILKGFDKLTEKKIEALRAKLSEVKKLRKRQVISLINVLPEDRDDLRLVLDKDYKNFTDDEKKLILEGIKSFI